MCELKFIIKCIKYKFNKNALNRLALLLDLITLEQVYIRALYIWNNLQSYKNKVELRCWTYCLLWHFAWYWGVLNRPIQVHVCVLIVFQGISAGLGIKAKHSCDARIARVVQHCWAPWKTLGSKYDPLDFIMFRLFNLRRLEAYFPSFFLPSALCTALSHEWHTTPGTQSSIPAQEAMRTFNNLFSLHRASW